MAALELLGSSGFVCLTAAQRGIPPGVKVFSMDSKRDLQLSG